jgi:hypothetical protein
MILKLIVYSFDKRPEVKTSMAESKNTVQKTFENATKVRAKAYAYIYEELVKELGAKKADSLFSKAIYRLGKDKAANYPESAKKSAEGVARFFIKDPVSRGAFKQSILSANDTEALIEMKNCALVAMWKEMGYSDARIRKLCDLAYQVDFGKIESLGYNLRFRSRIADNKKSCILEITRKKKSAK